MTLADTRAAVPDEPPRRPCWRFWRAPSYSQVIAPYAHVSPPHDHALTHWLHRRAGSLMLPDSARVLAIARWYLPRAAKVALKSPILITGFVFRELRPVTRGFGKCTTAYLGWVTGKHLAQAVATAEGQNVKARQLEQLHHHQKRLVTMSIVGGLALTGAGIWAYYSHLPWLLAAAGGLTVLWYLLGKRDQPEPEFVARKREPLHEGMSLRSITQSILAVLAEEAVQAEAHGLAMWDHTRKQWRLTITTFQEIKPEVAKAIGRGLYANDNSVRILNTGTESDKTITIQIADPLANVPYPPEIAHRSLSIAQPLTLGVSVSDYPFKIMLAGVHTGIVGKTGAGKSMGVMQAIIHAISACYNATLWGIDLTNGPLFSMWQGVIQRKTNQASPPERVQAAESILDDALAEMNRRTSILSAIAESDDPNATQSEWDGELATKYGGALIIMIDEFALLAGYDGKAGKIDLLGKVEEIMRAGRKVWVSICHGEQATGKNDTGTTTVHKQTMQWMVGSCVLADSDAVFGPDRRRAGYTPHDLKAATPQSVNDAGKVYIDAPGFGPDEYRTYRPLKNEETKRRARARVAAGLPTIGGVNEPRAVMDAELVPPGMAAVYAALDAFGAAHLPSELVVEHAVAQGESWTANSLADAVRAESGGKVTTRKARSEHAAGASKWCYHRTDLDAAYGPG